MLTNRDKALLIFCLLSGFFQLQSAQCDDVQSKLPGLKAGVREDSSTSVETRAESDVPVSEGFDHHEFRVGRWYESGVANRILIDYFGHLKFNPILSLEVGLSASMVQQAGPSLVGFEGKASFPNAKSQLVLGIQHERWPSWETTENRAELYWKFFPNENLNLSFGIAYRTPHYDYSTPIPFQNWSSNPDGELTFVYAFDWRFLQIDPVSFHFMVWDYDHMRLFTMDNIHYTLKGRWVLSPTLELNTSGTLGVTGVSGGILSVNQSIIQLGVTYGI